MAVCGCCFRREDQSAGYGFVGGSFLLMSSLRRFHRSRTCFRMRLAYLGALMLSSSVHSLLLGALGLAVMVGAQVSRPGGAEVPPPVPATSISPPSDAT